MIREAAYFWFRLFRTRGIGPKALAAIQRELIATAMAPEQVPLNRQVLFESYPRLAKLLADKVAADDADALWSEYESIREQGITVVHPGHPDAPADSVVNAERYGVSPVLFCRGQTRLLSSVSAAIVGSRNASEIGFAAARGIASGLAANGVNVVSGYAKGVDTQAHLGALQAEGTTTMVLSYGILEFTQKRSLFEFRLDQDAVAVSQFAPGDCWSAGNAMSRNKLVTALSRSLVVIESGPERDERGRMSGTFAAAQSALKMGRRLFVLDPDCFERPPAGNAKLLELGATAIDASSGAGIVAAASQSALLELNREARGPQEEQLFYW
jgi:DNA processing protein